MIIVEDTDYQDQGETKEKDAILHINPHPSPAHPHPHHLLHHLPFKRRATSMPNSPREGLQRYQERMKHQSDTILLNDNNNNYQHSKRYSERMVNDLDNIFSPNTRNNYTRRAKTTIDDSRVGITTNARIGLLSSSYGKSQSFTGSPSSSISFSSSSDNYNDDHFLKKDDEDDEDNEPGNTKMIEKEQDGNNKDGDDRDDEEKEEIIKVRTSIDNEEDWTPRSRGRSVSYVKPDELPPFKVSRRSSLT